MSLFKINFKKLIKEFICTILWILVFIKIFILDIERELFKNLDLQDHWMLNYRFAFYCFIIAILWYVVGSKRFFINLGYFLIYPIIVIFWRLPKLFLWKIPKFFYYKKNWIFMYAYLNSILNHLILLKSNLLKLSAFSISVLFIIYSSRQILLLFSLFSFILIVLYHFYERIRLAFAPIRMFRINLYLLSFKNKEFEDPSDKAVKEYNEFIESGETDEAKIETKKVNSIEQLVISHQVLSFISNRLNEFKQQRIYMMFSMLQILYTMFFSIFLISLINYTLYKLNPTNFLIKSPIEYFDFIYYSFHSALLNSVPNIEPISKVAKTVNMFAPFIILFISLFLIALFFTTKSDKYREEIDDVIEFSTQKIVKIENIIQSVFKYNIPDAITKLKEAKSFFSGILDEVKKTGE